MKRVLALALAAMLLLSGCGAKNTVTDRPAEKYNPQHFLETAPPFDAPAYTSRFDSEVVITLSDNGVTVDHEGVFTSNDIIYYEDRQTYDSGNPYGEGQTADRHTAEEAANHTVVNITEPGAYRVTGSLSAGQIRIDLGEDAYHDPEAVVELILDNAEITCTVAPAILFLNVYECDGSWSEESASSIVDTAAAGANLILAEGSRNQVNGSYVAKIYKDKEDRKKLWKQDGAIYSYMSMNVFGPGALDLTAENEGLDTELHLTVNGGRIAIRAGNDGINTNEDNVSVTTINGGDIHIIAGLGEEGDGIDSNGYLVINGGTVISAAHPAADAGLDSDRGSFVNGGTVIALGSAMDWAESDSAQVTMNLQFARYRDPSDAIVVTLKDGSEIFSYDPAADDVMDGNTRQYMGAVISCPDFRQGAAYLVYVGGEQMMYTGTDVRMGPDGFGGFGGGRHPEGDEMPEGWTPDAEGKRPEGEMPDWPDGKMPDRPNGEMPEWLEGGMPDWPEGEAPKLPDHGDFDANRGNRIDRFVEDGSAEGSIYFYMQDKVNCFSGLTAVSE